MIVISLCACNKSQEIKPTISKPTEDTTTNAIDDSFGWQGIELEAPKLKPFEYNEELAITHFADIETICNKITAAVNSDNYFHNVQVIDSENVVFPDTGILTYASSKTILIDGQNEAFDISLYTQMTDYASVNHVTMTMQSNALTKSNQAMAAKLLSIIDEDLGEYVVKSTDPDMKWADTKDELNDPTQLSEIIKVDNGYYTIDRFTANDCVIIDISAIADNLPNNLGIDGRKLIFNEIQDIVDAAFGSTFGSDPTENSLGGRFPIYNEQFGDVYAQTLIGEGAYTCINEFTITKTEQDENLLYTCEFMYDVMQEQDAIVSITQHMEFLVKNEEALSIESIVDSDIGFIVEMKQYNEFDHMTHEEKVDLVVTAASLLQHSTGFDGMTLLENSSVLQTDIPYQFFVKEGNASVQLVKSSDNGLMLSFNPQLFD